MRHLIVLTGLFSMLISGTGLAADISTLEQIKKSGEIRIGYRETEPPMSFLNKDKQPVGYSIELCLHIANEVKSTLQNPNIATKYIPVNASNRFDALRDNSIDILCGSTTKTLSRSELVDFTQLTFITGAAFLSLNSAKVEKFSDLKGKKVAVVKDTTTKNALEKNLRKKGSDAKIIVVDSAAEGVDLVVKGEVAAFSADQIVLIGLVVTHKDKKQFAVSDKVFSFEPFALAIRQNDSEFRLLADRTLARLNRSGNITKVFNQWFGKYITEVPALLEAMYILNATPE
ncbi:MAG: amino acid ABC transporter substrate-binding protein [Gammaproteobacteria bacterium]|nr:MAG: amino acid ABC transporter substrate-binding protein [Gammaproteobacteria bacterium]